MGEARSVSRAYLLRGGVENQLSFEAAVLTHYTTATASATLSAIAMACCCITQFSAVSRAYTLSKSLWIEKSKTILILFSKSESLCD